jgi:aminopeptidase N
VRAGKRRPDNLTREEAEARSALISDVRSDVTIDFSRPEDDTYRCDATIRFRSARPGAATFLDLVAPSVEHVELNGVLLPAAAFDGVRVHLPDLEGVNEVRVTANLEYSHSGVGLHRFRDPVDDLVYVFSDCEPFDAHRTYPCFDQPDLKARLRFTVLAPSDWEVASNMAVAEKPDRQVDDGVVRWVFGETPPLSPYITAILAGPYHVVRDRRAGVDLGIYCRQSLARYLDAEEIFEVTAQGFEFFTEAFGYPYPFGKYDQAFVPEFNAGAMENAGLVTFNEWYIFRSRVTDAARERRAETILHELAHMWFGDLVTMRWWDDLWLNESFATFASVLAQVQATRFSRGWTTFAEGEKTWAHQQDQLPTTHPIVADVPDTESVHVNFDGITYAKGAAVLRQLVAWVGEDAFLEGLRLYFPRHEYGNTDLGDFLSALEETSGRDLRAWSKEWLETAGLNTLGVEAEIDGDSGRDTYRSVAVVQEAPPEWPNLRPHRAAIGLYDAGPDGLVRRTGMELDIVGARTEVEALRGQPVPDLLLVNDQDLAYAKTRLDERSLRTVTERLGELRDPLARAICWRACWDMVRDAEMPARDYLTLVLGHAEAEDDVGVVQRLLGQLSAAVELYGDPANRDAAFSTMAEGLWAAFARSAPGSDHQLAWGRAFIAAARTDKHAAFIRGMLDGTEAPEGLAVDTELRWHVVASLSASGHGDEQLIEDELARDHTDAGLRHAAAARAARPVPEAKAAAWTALIEDRSLPTATVESITDGFQQFGQKELLTRYVDPYFEAIEPVWAERDREMALAFTRSMYPSRVVDQRTIDLTDSYLSERSAAVSVRRFLLEGRDGIVRALRARATDAAAG